LEQTRALQAARRSDAAERSDAARRLSLLEHEIVDKEARLQRLVADLAAKEDDSKRFEAQALRRAAAAEKDAQKRTEAVELECKRRLTDLEAQVDGMELGGSAWVCFGVW